MPDRADSTTQTTASTLPAASALGPVELLVSDLGRTVDFYTRVLGLDVHGRAGDVAALGSGEDDVLILRELPEAKPQGAHAGLFHVALLYPSRLELARVATRIAESETPVSGLSDHGTHEAIYLSDPDGIGLELAADRPRSEWPDPFFSAGPAPLDTRGLLAMTRGETVPARAEGVLVGHVHLHVADVAEAMRFYRDVIGFEETADLGQAGFVAFGGYHHHVAFNVWRGEGVPPAPDDAVGMHHFTLELPNAGELEALEARIADAGIEVEDDVRGRLVRDPSGNALLIESADGPPADA
ncbi:hypothetical protein HJD18_09285 [Thermoleophilia bacterium SCSIO 60948]|nr:hypothetical protein HJD18_09285 [Thermoleophilia bacterium SCSIO 60948]